MKKLISILSAGLIMTSCSSVVAACKKTGDKTETVEAWEARTVVNKLTDALKSVNTTAAKPLKIVGQLVGKTANPGDHVISPTTPTTNQFMNLVVMNRIMRSSNQDTKIAHDYLYQNEWDNYVQYNFTGALSASQATAVTITVNVPGETLKTIIPKLYVQTDKLDNTGYERMQQLAGIKYKEFSVTQTIAKTWKDATQIRIGLIKAWRKANTPTPAGGYQFVFNGTYWNPNFYGYGHLMIQPIYKTYGTNISVGKIRKYILEFETDEYYFSSLTLVITAG